MRELFLVCLLGFCGTPMYDKRLTFLLLKTPTAMNTEHIDICQQILQKLEEKERNVAGLARQLDCDPDNLRKKLKNKRDIPSKLLYQISEVMEEDFHSSYSEKLKEKQNR
jgi:hypothetical protein